MDESNENVRLIWPEIAVAADILVFARRTEPSAKPPGGNGGAPAFPDLAYYLDILLVRRKYPPFDGFWALPGGGVEIDEDLEAAARRELLEETGLGPSTLIQFRAYGAPGRDPRCRVVSVVFWTLLNAPEAPAAGDDAVEAAWFPLVQVPPLAFDHSAIVDDAINRLVARGFK